MRAVQRAFELLGLLGDDPESATLSELARRSGLPTSTAARLLATLEATEFVQRERDGRYVPGLRLAQLGLGALRRSRLYDLAEPHLHRLVDATSETANLAVRASATEWIYLRQVMSRQAIRYTSWIGRMLPLGSTAVGAALQGEVGSEGFVVRRGGLEPDVTSVAAPVRDADGAVAGALNIVGPSYRIDERAANRFGRSVAEQARLLSAQLSMSAQREALPALALQASSKETRT
ncbi:MAG TPA: IclR family transcriptional regulator [Burkholderiaceae bacterium]|nr:IclR family transcriptional regulator [Burkholderiaceae bacterium]